MTGTDQRLDSEVFVLGAGFSKAWDSRFPTAYELGKECLARVAEEAGPAMKESFKRAAEQLEPWMSQLSEDQPYLTDSENARNRWWFTLIRTAIHEILSDLSRNAGRRAIEEAPQWAPDFIRYAHQKQAAVITFNYDTLIEGAVGVKMGEVRWPDASFLRVDDITAQKPPAPPTTATTVNRGPRPGSFTVLKLHGSIDWWWDEQDPSGTSMVHKDTWRSGGDNPTGRSPFIVPPSFTKSRYFGNIVLRQLWRDATARIRTAQRVTFLGYSLPVEDRTFAGLLTTALDPSTVVSIADHNADSVRRNLEELGLDQLVDDNQVYDRSKDPEADPISDLIRARTTE